MTYAGPPPHREGSALRAVLERELEEVRDGIAGGLDIHRQQITYDWVDCDDGQSGRGRISPADRVGFRKWLGQFDGKKVELVVEGCTGWRFIAEECAAASVEVHVADPAEAAGARSRKQCVSYRKSGPVSAVDGPFQGSLTIGKVSAVPYRSVSKPCLR
jgi:hypothetical protein